MLKLTKKADYGLMALKYLAEQKSGSAHSAKDIAEAYHIPPQLLAKILQTLAKGGLLVSHAGTNGGYALARPANEISAFEVIRTIDGPIILTHCFTEHEGRECDQTALCPVREPLRKVHEGILRLLSGITISDLASEDMQVPAIPAVVSGIQLSGVPPKRPNMESETNGI